MAQRRAPRKKGQPQKSSKHSDLYTDEDPKGTIHGLGFKDGATARKGVAKVNKSGREHAHKVQATLVMKQRAKVAKARTKDPEKKKDIGTAYGVWSDHLEKLKKKTRQMKESLQQLREFIEETLSEAVSCRVCGDPTDGNQDTCDEHREEPTKLELLGTPEGQRMSPEQSYNGRTVRTRIAPVDGRPNQRGWRGF